MGQDTTLDSAFVLEGGVEVLASRTDEVVSADISTIY